jgi:hypothetical protein
MFLYIQMNPNLRCTDLRFSHISGSFFVVPAKTPYNCIYFFLMKRLLNFRFFLHVRYKNLVPTLFLEPQFEIHVLQLWVLVVLIMPQLCMVEENQYQNVLRTMAKCTISSQKLACVWFTKKACGRNHLHISTFTTQHSHWVITYLGCKLYYDWSLYAMPAE